ncbi:hypothetical protein BKA70DRAFT_1559439 [Coprinopsis sp. MPI-PUGE-AT-0042]|nr:hypothetical protein BKA70DRAFT_1559439 [Coprinopsis sp. MPI-PUGE-AT-0042]
MRKLFGPSKSKNKPSKDFGAEVQKLPPFQRYPCTSCQISVKAFSQQRQKQTEAQVPPQAVPHGQASAGVGGPEPGWENIPTPGNTPGVGPPPPLMGGGVSRSSSYHSIPSPNLNPNYNGRPPSPSLTNTSFSRQAAGYSPNPNDYGARPVPNKEVLCHCPRCSRDPGRSRSSRKSSAHIEYASKQSPIRIPKSDSIRAPRMAIHSSSRCTQVKEEEGAMWHHHPNGKRNAVSGVQVEIEIAIVETSNHTSYLAATNSEDWSVVLEVCDRASLNETNAKEAVKALRSEFKYGQPHAQLAAAKLWAIMLRNSTDISSPQSRQRKFLDTLEELIKSGRSTPVVTDRLLEIIAAAAYASGRHKKGSEKDGFRGLWLRVKPADKPDEGIPFDSEDAMFSPPSARASTYETGAIVPAVALQQASPLPAENFAPVRHKPAGTRNRIIPHDEDIRRLFQECKMAEFHKKCENSQKLVFAQIEWATAQAEQSRERGKERESRKKKKDGKDGDDETTEEKLLGALLGANEELLSALRQYDDLYQILVEKKSRKDVRMDPREIAQHQLQQQTEHLAVAHGVGASRSRSPSPARSFSGSPPSNSTPPSHGGHGQTSVMPIPNHAKGPQGSEGSIPPTKGSYTNINQPAQLHGQPGAVARCIFTRSASESTLWTSLTAGNFSLRSRTPSPNGNNRPDEYSNNTQQSSAYSGSYDDHCPWPAKQQGYGCHYGGYQDGAHHGGTGYQDDNASSIYYPQGGKSTVGNRNTSHTNTILRSQYGAEQMQEEEVEYDEEGVPIRPSAKALGKRKAQEPVEEEHNPRASITSEDL